KDGANIFGIFLRSKNIIEGNLGNGWSKVEFDTRGIKGRLTRDQIQIRISRSSQGISCTAGIVGTKGVLYIPGVHDNPPIDTDGPPPVKFTQSCIVSDDTDP